MEVRDEVQVRGLGDLFPMTSAVLKIYFSIIQNLLGAFEVWYALISVTTSIINGGYKAFADKQCRISEIEN